MPQRDPHDQRHDSAGRLRREKRTVEIMIGMYCRAHHRDSSPSAKRRDIRPGDLCPVCTTLLDYSDARIERCRFGAEKPTCARCTVHCFKPDRREHIRVVMRYAGPRMTLHHPYLALRHLLDRRRSGRLMQQLDPSADGGSNGSKRNEENVQELTG